MNKFKKSKIIKYSIVFVVVLIIFISGFMVYKNLFSSTESSRFNEIEKHKLSNDEINSAKEKLNEIENIKSVDIYTKSKIIRIFVKLESDTDFEKIKEISNQLISSFKEENLKYYDLEMFIESSNEESEIYPKIGYKHKKTSEFVW